MGIPRVTSTIRPWCGLMIGGGMWPIWRKFAETVGKDYADGRPLNLYCHSMGGGIGASVLETHPTLFDKAVLSCPMIAPVTGMPNWLASVLAGAMCRLGLGAAHGVRAE